MRFVDEPKNQDEHDTIATSSAKSTTSSGNQKQATATAEGIPKSQNAILTQYATSHLTKLHLLAGQTSAALSATTQDMVKLLPRLTHELDQLRQETKTLQEGIQIVRNDINSVDSSDTTQALDRLKYLDLVKTRMEATHSALREAENWRNLEAEANDIFAKGDFTRAATRLSEAERSLVVYKNTNVEGDRMALLLALKDQLQQQVMGKVREAIERKDTATCQTLINIFGLIGRQEVFQEYYISQRREPLMKQWNHLTETMNLSHRGNFSATTQTSAGDTHDFASVLQTFYKDASNMLHDEFSWITSIFSDPSAIIHSLVQDIFTHIDPTMQTALKYVCNTLGEEGSLPMLISAFAATESFGTRMERIVSQPLVGNQREHTGNRPRAGTLVQDSSSKEGKGIHSSRSPFGPDSLEIGSIHDPHEWAFILYEPFMAYQRDYGKLEGAYLRVLLSKTVPSMASYRDNFTKSKELTKSSSNLVKIMTTTNNLAFNLAEGAIARCMRLTHGFGVPGLLDGLNGFFKDIMDRYTEILMECRQRSGLQAGDSRGVRPSSTYDNTEDNDGEDSEGWDEDMDEQDPRLFQMGLRLMVLCRQFCLKLEQLDLKTKKALRGVENLIKLDRATQDSSQQGPHHHNSAGSLDHGLSSSGLKINAQPPNASIALLQQSNLNSFRLSEILDIVKKSDPREEHAVAGDGTSTADQLSIENDLSLEPKANHLFLHSHQRVVQLTKFCQRFIFDSVYIPLVRPLSDLASLPCWTEGIDQQNQTDEGKGARRIHQSTMGGTRTDVIKFRSSPSDYMEELISQIQELPLTFGMYHAGLRFGIHMLPYADKPFELAHQLDSTEQPSTLVTGADENGVGGHNDNDLGVGEATTGADALVNEKLDESEEQEEEDDSAVTRRWISSLSRAAMHTMIERLYNPNLPLAKDSATSLTTNTLPSSQRGRFAGATISSISSAGGQHLTRLSDAGAKQLELDLSYFVGDCLGALAIEPTPSIRAFIKALRLNESGLSMALQQIQQQREELNTSMEESNVGSKRSSTLPESQQISLEIPGAPLMPSVLVVAEEDVAGHLELEQKVLEWVVRLRGFNISNS
ncbi:hypothetical protein BGX27_010715 [Mortierella sp. AM989]|nr:hypothetical protein BGX27_010715 [Mortierella sp. AM989]